MRYSIRQLQVFSQTARFGNISRAAEQLSITQSAASTSLKELESQFDIRLFDRVGKKLVLNTLGKSLRADIEELLDKAQQVEQKLSKQAEEGSLSIGCTLTIADRLLPDILKNYLNHYPEAKPQILSGNTKVITEKLLTFELDIALIEGHVNHPDLEVNEWHEDELMVFCASDNVFAGQAVEFEALIEQPWVLRESGSGTRQIFENNLPSNISELNVLLELSQSQAIIGSVINNIGIGCLSKLIVRDAIASKRIAPIHIKDCNFQRKLYRVTHKQKYETQALEHFINEVKQCHRY